MQDLVKVDAIRLSIHWRIFIEQIDAHGLVFVVTGSSSGIGHSELSLLLLSSILISLGEELCKILVKANARVIMACRDVSKAQKVADKLLELRKDAKACSDIDLTISGIHGNDCFVPGYRDEVRRLLDDIGEEVR